MTAPLALHTTSFEYVLATWHENDALARATRSLDGETRDGNWGVLDLYENILLALDIAFPDRQFLLSDYVNSLFDQPTSGTGQRYFRMKAGMDHYTFEYENATINCLAPTMES